jgi:tripartite-type tricarboxylate transporter receptor subunit TctC
MIRDKRVVPLGVTTRERAPSLPDVPSISEEGLPGFQFDPWFGFLAPAATPRATVEWLNREINEALQNPEVRARLDTLGAQASPMSAGAFDKYVHDQIALMRKIVETQGIRLE